MARSLIGAIVDRPRNAAGDSHPVGYEMTPAIPWIGRGGVASELRAFGDDPTLFSVVSTLSTAVAQTEWGLYLPGRTGDPDSRTEILSHAALDLVHEPNPYMDWAEFCEITQQQYELTGETFWVFGFPDAGSQQIPISIWPVRTDRMVPVPSQTRYLGGYVYTEPDGKKVPFPVEHVIHIKAPDPLDVYHGLSPVRALFSDLEASQAAARWNANFFTNSAQPGGVIEVEGNLSDELFDLLQARWNQQHRGVANSHRVAILEAGMQWRDRSMSMRDMQFVELREASDRHTMTAFGVGKTLLGQTESVNRATAEAAEYVFGKHRVAPRLNRIRGKLNRRLLRFYANGDRYMFDYESPVTGNVETENAERDSRVAAVVALIGAGADPASAAEAYGLPVIDWAPPAPAPVPVLPPSAPPAEIGPGDPVPVENLRNSRRVQLGLRPRAQGDPDDLDPSSLPNVARLQDRFDEVLDWLLDAWGDIEAGQAESLIAQVLTIADGGSITDLTGLEVDIDEAADLLAAAMEEIAVDASEAVVEEARDQGVTLSTVEVDDDVIQDVAKVVAGLTAARLIDSAIGAAARANSRSASPEDVGDAVRDALDGLSAEGPRPRLSGALTGTQNEARLATLASGPVGAVYAQEMNDSNTCGPCREVDGRWLGNTDEIDRITKSYPGGAYGGFIDCEGRERCRGTIVGVWRR